MNVTFRQLRLVLALADAGSISGAARAMHVTQPTASMQLRDVAETIGLPIYEVVAKRIYLTDAGRELVRTARAMVREWDDFRQKVDAAKGLTRGQLKVAVVSTAKYFIPRLLGTFCEAYPQIDVALEVLNRDGVVGRLRENMDDLYVMSMPPNDIDVEDHIFMPNPLVMIAPASHPLAKRRRIALNTLKSERFILREKGSGTRMAADAHFKAHRFTPNVRLVLGSNEAIRAAVAGNLGIAVVSMHALDAFNTRDAQYAQLANADIAVLKVDDFPIKSQWHIVRQKGKRLSPIAAVFEAHLALHASQWRTAAKAS